MTRAALVLGLVLCACKEPTGANTSGLVVVSDTSPTEFGDPPECGSDTEGSTGGATDSTGAEPTGTSGQVPEDMSEGEAFCAAQTSAPACDGIVHGGGVCRWLDVVPVYPGTCDITQLFRTCVFVPDEAQCPVPTSCDQIGLGVFGRRGCDGAVELIMAGPSEGLCGTPAGWSLCAGDDAPPECSCACS
ncbi:hypothetical protein OV203_24600 [Nannocystis sp. ILAH1]|uniref:hypothetical protein n=1 Tax=unclassified Nannocystis TaxID=2627009 RepID=UPI00227122B2|nr:MULTISPECIES: hypothetical protein [unclassified Nannocystis]MCY0990343.1 hypothetical protein [Nannocystis sp. ILAH1]MCY1069368.1 hypothetical protein [Nannocystis sp. RBIL2]